MARPAYFAWDSPKIKGAACIVTAAEWNRFCLHVNALRVYRGVGEYAFGAWASAGLPLTAGMYNDAVAAIRGIAGAGSGLYAVFPGQAVTADLMEGLRAAANAVM